MLLRNGAIDFGAEVTFNVTTDGGGYYEASVRPLVYRADDGDELVYVNGALFRQYDDAAVMFGEPRFVAGDDTLVPLVVTDDDSQPVSTDGTRRLLVRTDVTDRDVERYDAPANLTVTSPRAAAWGRYFESELALDCTGPDDGLTGAVECELPGDVTVQGVFVDVALS